MGISYNPSIVTEDLVLALDPQNTRSYVGSGTTWTDLTNSGNSGTLTNGPVFIPGGPFNNSGGSVYFDDTSKYLDISSSSDFAYGTGDFTWECWVYIIQGGYALDHGSNGGTIVLSHTSVSLYYNTTVGTGSVLYTTGFGTIPTETWTHIAAVRSGGTTYLYTNGVLSSSASDSHNYGSQAVRIGQYGGGGSNYFGGYISNLRVINGTALYTSNFTPPTGPLEAIDDTALLTCQGGAITDNGPSSHAITVNGDAEAITASAFEFDGTNDRVEVGTFSLSYLTFSTWVRKTSTATNQGICRKQDGWAVSQYNGTLQVAPGTSWTFYNTGYTIPLNKWVNIVYTYSGTGITGSQSVYVDGELISTFSNGSGAISANSNTVRIGFDDNGWYWGGSIGETKLYNRALTAAEVKQNYNALRGRYGI